MVVTGFGGGFVPLGGRERVGETYVEDDELRFEADMGDESTEVERKKRREVQKWRIVRCWETLDPGAWSMPGTRETEGESAARQFTSPSPGEQCIVGVPDEVCSKMGECMVSVVWRCLAEGRRIGGTGSGRDYPLG